MNIRDLQYLVAVYDTQSFSKAAERCFVSQPTLSGQLKKLEETLGAVLIERSTRKVLFTDTGKQIVAEAREMLDKVVHIKSIAQQHDDPMSGDLHLGLIPTIGPYLLPKIIPKIKQHYPQLNVFLHELQTKTLLEKLHTGELDGAILAKLNWAQSLKEWPLYTEPFNFAISDNDPLATKDQAVRASILKNRKVLMLEDGHCLRDQALGICFSEGAEEDKQFQATSMNTLLHMVASGAGSTLVPYLACDSGISGISYLPFKGSIPSREVVLITRFSSTKVATFDILAKLITQQVTAVMPNVV